jgi:arylsulfatase A-like enzyme
VLFIVMDDMGFGQLGCYGSPIATPNIDDLAAEGLRFSNMHTKALCSPSRSCMLTGRNHHSNGLACITEGSMGYPGSNGYIPFENGFLSEILLQKVYNTYAVGKWHLTPAEATSAAGPYDRWPSAGASSASTASWGVTPTSTTPSLCGTTPRWSPRHPRAGLPPHPGSGETGQGDDRRRQVGGPKQTLLPLLRHRCNARAAPCAEGMGRQLQGAVR